MPQGLRAALTPPPVATLGWAERVAAACAAGDLAVSVPADAGNVPRLRNRVTLAWSAGTDPGGSPL